RGDTTVVDAYLSPILRRYVDQVERALRGDSAATVPRLQFMQSSGGLTDAHRFQGKDAILSGPAGGIVGAVEVSRLAGFDTIIGFDMGGTSTDVTHYDGEEEGAFVTAGGRGRPASPPRGCESTPWLQAAARSARSTARAFASGRNPQAPIRDPHPIGAAARLAAALYTRQLGNSL